MRKGERSKSASHRRWAPRALPGRHAILGFAPAAGGAAPLLPGSSPLPCGTFPMRSMLTWIQRHELLLLGGVALVAFVLGMVGVRWQGGDDVGWGDAVYFALRLFAFDFDLGGEGGRPYAAANPALQVARFLAPATVACAVIKAFTLATARQLTLWRIARWKHHAVICGAGERGRELALALRREGKRVVVIERDDQAETLADVVAAGGRVVIGSALDPLRQAEARLHTASTVIAVTPSGESNLQIVLAASRRPAGIPLRALAHASRAFVEMFAAQPPFDRIVDGRECGFFDHEAAAARLLVGRYGPELVPAMLTERRSPRILLAGDGGLLPELLGVVVTQCQYAGAGIPRVVLLTSDADAFGREFPLHHPQLGLVAEVTVHRMTLAELLRVELEALDGEIRSRPFDLAFVACREDIDTLGLARHLSQQAGCLAGDVIAGLRPSTQLMRLFIGTQPLSGVQAHDIVALGCSGDIVLHGALDRVARGIHESYLAGQLREGRALGATPALVPWESLPDGLRQANRAQADHIPFKQRTLALSRTPETLEALSIAEHRRWMAEKIVAGWRQAQARDDARRLHPAICPYDDLSEAEKQKDRDTVTSAAS